MVPGFQFWLCLLVTAVFIYSKQLFFFSSVDYVDQYMHSFRTLTFQFHEIPSCLAGFLTWLQGETFGTRERRTALSIHKLVATETLFQGNIETNQAGSFNWKLTGFWFCYWTSSLPWFMTWANMKWPVIGPHFTNDSILINDFTFLWRGMLFQSVEGVDGPTHNAAPGLKCPFKELQFWHFCIGFVFQSLRLPLHGDIIAQLQNIF